ncbi:MAG: class B sortase [Angelakisella sp.]|nr:class B sortase [Angelakisella sp.]
MKKPVKLRLRQILHFLMVLCLIGILCSAFIIFTDNLDNIKGVTAYRQLSILMDSSKLTQGQKKTVTQIMDETKEQEHISEVDFTSLEKINPDIVGWIGAKDTEINYPVVKGKDNDHYLNYMFNGERNKLGSIFMDYRNSSNFSDKNTIIYGHNMKDGSMFSPLTNYKNQQYYNSFPTLLLYTPEGDFTIELFAGIIVDGDYESIRLTFKDDLDFQSYVDLLKEKSTFESDVTVKSGDQIITLSTCSYEFDNARYALYGRLVLLDNGKG